MFIYLMKQIEVYTRIEDLPKLLTSGTIHSVEMFNVLIRCDKTKPHLFVCKEGDDIIAHLLVVEQREFRLIPPGIYTWYSIYGEGVYKEEYKKEKENIFALFIDNLLKLFKFKHSFIEIRNIADSSFAYKVLSDRNFFPRRCIRIYNSLHSKTPQERLARAYKTHIKNAEKRGVTCEQATHIEDIEIGIELLYKYYISKIRRHLPQKKILKELLIGNDGTLSQQFRMFIVRYKDKIIGCSICFYENDRAYLAYSCGLRKSHPLLYPGIMAIWVAITDAYKQGYSHFEFCETNLFSRKSSGYINLVLNFGGKQVSTLRWYHFKWNRINKILRAIYV